MSHIIRDFSALAQSLSIFNVLFSEWLVPLYFQEVQQMMKELSPVMFEDFVKPFQINLEEVPFLVLLLSVVQLTALVFFSTLAKTSV